jgi:lysozyme
MTRKKNIQYLWKACTAVASLFARLVWHIAILFFRIIRVLRDYIVTQLRSLNAKAPKTFWFVLFLLSLCGSFSLFEIKKNKDAEISETSPSSRVKSFGIDVSHNQGYINWDKVMESHHPIKFVIVRSTMGKNRKDERFIENMKQLRQRGLLSGAYHYYDPNENSSDQAQNFIETVKLLPGDIIPVLDIERKSVIQSLDNLRKGVQNWLNIIESHYGVRPMIYTGQSFYEDHLMDFGFGRYPLWIAAYSKEKRSHSLIIQKAHVHQFSEKLRVYGINENTVDGNDMLRTDGIFMP